MEFIESFMKFSFDDDSLFRIEKDEAVQSRPGRKVCECVVYLNPHIAFIEAKASSPRSTNQDAFQIFIEEIKQKFEDSIQLFADIRTKALGEDAFQRLPLRLRQATDDRQAYRIYLIIHGHREDWLSELLDTLREALRDVVKRWQMRDSNVKVLNETMAMEMGIITDFIPISELAAVRHHNGHMNESLAKRWFEEHSGSYSGGRGEE
jgi:septum formation topological specificity factor MinE